jgi:hypothetical protein
LLAAKRCRLAGCLCSRAGFVHAFPWFDPAPPLLAPGSAFSYWDDAQSQFGCVLTMAAGESRGEPGWTSNARERRAAFRFPGGGNRMDVTWNSGLWRYLLVMRSRPHMTADAGLPDTSQPGAVNQFSIFDAPEQRGHGRRSITLSSGKESSSRTWHIGKAGARAPICQPNG